MCLANVEVILYGALQALACYLTPGDVRVMGRMQRSTTLFSCYRAHDVTYNTVARFFY